MIHMVLGPKGGAPYRSLSQLVVNRPDKAATEKLKALGRDLAKAAEK